MLVLKDVSVIDGAGNPPFRATVVVDGERIREVARGCAVNVAPEGAEIIDGRGKYLTPGLIDAHNHLGVELGDEEAQMREPDPLIALRAARRASLNLENCVTSMRTMGEKNGIDAAYRRAIEEGSVPGPRLQISGAAIVRTGGHGYYLGTQVDGPVEVRRAVRENLRLGADWIKIIVTGGGSTRSSSPLVTEYTAEEVRAAVDEASNHGRPVAVHAHGGKGADFSLCAGVRSIEHGFFLSESQLERMARQDTWLVSTLGFLLIERAGGEEKRPEWYLERLAKMKDSALSMTVKAREIGVKIAVGQDCEHGRLVDEIRCLEMAGFSRLEAIRAATLRGAELMGVDSDTGTVEVGKMADLVLLEGNPLDDLSVFNGPRLVLKGGIVATDLRRI